MGEVAGGSRQGGGNEGRMRGRERGGKAGGKRGEIGDTEEEVSEE